MTSCLSRPALARVSQKVLNLIARNTISGRPLAGANHASYVTWTSAGHRRSNRQGQWRSLANTQNPGTGAKRSSKAEVGQDNDGYDDEDEDDNYPEGDMDGADDVDNFDEVMGLINKNKQEYDSSNPSKKQGLSECLMDEIREEKLQYQDREDEELAQLKTLLKTKFKQFDKTRHGILTIIVLHRQVE
jgi:hypothetical protein